VINAGAATTPAITAATGVVVDISGGFSRTLLPATIAELRPSMVYAVSGVPVASLDDAGIVLDITTSNTFVAAHTSAGMGGSTGAASGASQIMWMQNLVVRGPDAAAGSVAFTDVSAQAAGTGSHAEVGIQDLSMGLAAGSGALNGRVDVSARSAIGAQAHVQIAGGNIIVSGGTGSAANVVSTYAHMGEGEGTEAGLLASASGAGSSAGVTVLDNLTLSASGDDVYAYNSGIFSEGFSGGSAFVQLEGNLAFNATGRLAHAYALVVASSDSTANSNATIHSQENLRETAIGSEQAMTRAALRAIGDGEVDFDGHVSLVSDGPIANSHLQVLAEGSSSQIRLGGIDMTVNGTSSGHGWLDLYSSHAEGIKVDVINVSVAANSDAEINIQSANDAATGHVDATFLAHDGVPTGGEGLPGISIGEIHLMGSGEVTLNANLAGGEIHGYRLINQDASLGQLDMRFESLNIAIGPAASIVVNGFSAAHDSVIINGVAADSANFWDAGSYSDQFAMSNAINTALDGTHTYVFAVYTGTADVNFNGVADDQNMGILAWDPDAEGQSVVLYLPGVTSMTPADLA
jgi:hypothetical protein